MSPRLLNNTLRAGVAVLLAALPAAAVSGCGSSSPSAQSLVNDTFSSSSPIKTGQVELSFGLTPSGGKSSGKPFAVKLSGPFDASQTGKFPRFALKLDLNAAGHAVQAGATATGTQFFVNLAGTWFVAPESVYKAIEQGYAQATKENASAKSSSAFSSLGIEPRRWLVNPTKAGTTTVAGVQTYHLTSAVNTEAFLHDVSRLSQSGGQLGSALPGASALSPSALAEVGKAIHGAHVDIYTGKEDHLLRRLELTATISSTAQTRSLLGGAKSAALSLQLQFAQLNKTQSIAAPANPRPFSELLPALQQLLGSLQSATGGALPTGQG